MKKRYTSSELMAAIDNLANATAQGFAEVFARFEQIDGRLAQGDSRFVQIDNRFDRLERCVNNRFEKFEYAMNKRFDSVDLRFDAFERRLSKLEA